MNAEYINPFIQGSQSVLHSVCGEAPSLGKLFVKNAPYTPSQVAITVSIVGDIQGWVIYNMQETTGCFIASKMMFGMPIPALDEMSQSALAELSNMISGNVATIFSGKGINIDITPPHFLINSTTADFPEIKNVANIICIPLQFAEGHIFEIDFATV